MKQLKPICMFLLMLTISISVFAQNRITGNVTDPSGEPVIGASIIEKGTTNGTITDFDGNFSLNVSSNNAVLEISYIGYKKLEIRANDRNLKKIVLAEDSELLDEVVVVGYGTMKKESLTGSVTVVNDKIFKEKGGLSSPLQALQGQVPGVIITRSSSAPGDESWSMSLRGATSKNTTEPLIVIDGVAYESTNELRLLNPSDIETINFLKDGSAAIYGSRAAGGVVLVTTKKGKEGKTKVEYSGSATLKTVGLMPKLMNVDQWADGVIAALENDDNASNVWYTYAQLAKQYKGSYIDLATSPNPFGTAAFTDVSDFVFADDVNWLGSLFGDTWSTEQNLSISGGSDRSSYRISLGYLYDGSTLQYGKNNNQRYNFRINNTYKLSNSVSLESAISYQRQEQVAPTDIGSVLTVSVPMPGLPLTTIDGKPYAWGSWGSPVAKVSQGGNNELSVSAINISETLNYKVTDWLSANGNIGYNTSSASRNKVTNSIDYYNYLGTKKVLTTPTQANSSYEQTSSRTDFYSFAGYLNAHHTFAKKHDVSLTVGAQYEFKDYTYYGIKIKDIQEGLDIVNGSGEVTLVTDDNKDKVRFQHAVLSYYGRFNYAYDGRYLFEFNGRYDGSSKFQPENRWNAFFGVSAGWRIKQEAFMQGVEWLDDLKLRLSYAEMGNQSGVKYYDGVQLYSLESSSGAYVGSDKLSYIKTSGTLASNNRTWERIANYNLALDFALLNNKLTGTVEAFMRRNNNMLVSLSYPGTLGDKAPEANEGKFKGWGYEGQLTYRDKIGDVNYHVGGTLTFARNELTDIGGSTVIKDGYVATQQGYPLNTIFGLRYGGKIQNEEQLAAYKAKYLENNGVEMPAGLRVGDNMYCDENDDGILDHNDFINLGSDSPEISYSFNLGAEYKGFDISLVFQGAANRFVYRGIDNWTVPFRANYTNTVTTSIGRTWSEDNPNAYYAPYTNDSNLNNWNYRASSLTAQNASYIRLKNVTIGYTFPRDLLRKTKVFENARIYVTGADLWESTDIKDGWDPEAAREVTGTKRYPFTRNYTFGVNLTF
ncbi:TonB-dependent receptor [Bacteroides sp. 51]|uniref:SusC/RagA family TonB-linked outer membrane protein n=1 Tax=Bacteroides sp. 51 TaxID=2302938 RepID=UPI0013D1782B|nr:TonB-dependent receptor [Bacteroides sp. 51]NDV83665.1 TonB-dependent receptor [Bacteroides sp. 51]